MKYKFISIGILFLLSFIIPIRISIAYQYVDNVNEGISTFFLTSLDVGENIDVNVTHTGSGNFTLFLFDQRPISSYVNIDKTLDNEIFTVAVIYSLDDNPYINYTATESKIYYIQIILLDDGPDTFFLECNRQLSRYYIPSIPGYPDYLIISLILVVSSLLVVVYRRKIVK